MIGFFDYLVMYACDYSVRLCLIFTITDSVLPSSKCANIVGKKYGADNSRYRPYTGQYLAVIQTVCISSWKYAGFSIGESQFVVG